MGRLYGDWYSLSYQQFYIALTGIVSCGKSFWNIKLPFPMGISYSSATFALPFPTYINTCSDRYVVRLLNLNFFKEMWSTYSNELHMLLNSGTVKHFCSNYTVCPKCCQWSILVINDIKIYNNKVSSAAPFWSTLASFKMIEDCDIR